MRAVASRRKVPAQVAGAEMTEAQLQSAVLRLCTLLGLSAYHTHDSRRSQPGFPDLVIAGPSGSMFRELKTVRGRVSAEQEQWLTVLRAGGADARVWRPAELANNTIYNELKVIARTHRQAGRYHCGCSIAYVEQTGAHRIGCPGGHP